MATDWVTSRWMRGHDWDWQNDMPADLDGMGKQRATLVPQQFFYHPCRMVRRTGGGLGQETGAIEYVAYEPVPDLLLRAFDEPKPLSFMHRGSRGRGPDYIKAVNHSIRELQQAGLLIPDGEDEPIDCAAVFWTARFLFGLMQLEEEFVPVLEMVAAIKPRRVVEIGTCHGGSLFSWAQAAAADARLVSIDLPHGAGGGGYTPEYGRRFAQFCAPDQDLTCILADSAADSTLQHTREALGGELIDFLFIDGDHSYEGAKGDFERYGPMVRPGGLVMFHDVQHQAENPEVLGVQRLWAELRERHETAEFVGSQGVSLGIGVLTV
jgi:predicted O-methyltransferase YrrM